MASKTNKTSSLRSGENTVSSPEMAFSLDWGMCVSQGRPVCERSRELILEGCVRVSQRKEGSSLRKRKNMSKGKKKDTAGRFKRTTAVGVNRGYSSRHGLREVSVEKFRARCYNNKKYSTNIYKYKTKPLLCIIPSIIT